MTVDDANRMTPKMDDAKDGFDLIEYPCEFDFKAMVKVANLAADQTPKQAMRALITESELGEVLEVSSSASRTGRFESVTLKVKLQNRGQLESIYRSLANDPNVVMTL